MEKQLLEELGSKELQLRVAAITDIMKMVENDKITPEYAISLFPLVTVTISDVHMKLKVTSMKVLQFLLLNFIGYIDAPAVVLPKLCRMMLTTQDEMHTMTLVCIQRIIQMTEEDQWKDVVKDSLMKSRSAEQKIFFLDILYEYPGILDIHDVIELMHDTNIDIALKAQRLVSSFGAPEIKYAVAQIVCSNRMPERNRMLLYDASREMYEWAVNQPIETNKKGSKKELPTYMQEIVYFTGSNREKKPLYVCGPPPKSPRSNRSGSAEPGRILRERKAPPKRRQNGASYAHAAEEKRRELEEEEERRRIEEEEKERLRLLALAEEEEEAVDEEGSPSKSSSRSKSSKSSPAKAEVKDKTVQVEDYDRDALRAKIMGWRLKDLEESTATDPLTSSMHDSPSTVQASADDEYSLSFSALSERSRLEDAEELPPRRNPRRRDSDGIDEALRQAQSSPDSKASQPKSRRSQSAKSNFADEREERPTNEVYSRESEKQSTEGDSRESLRESTERNSRQSLRQSEKYSIEGDSRESLRELTDGEEGVGFLSSSAIEAISVSTYETAESSHMSFGDSSTVEIEADGRPMGISLRKPPESRQLVRRVRTVRRRVKKHTGRGAAAVSNTSDSEFEFERGTEVSLSESRTESEPPSEANAGLPECRGLREMRSGTWIERLEYIEELQRAVDAGQMADVDAADIVDSALKVSKPEHPKISVGVTQLLSTLVLFRPECANKRLEVLAEHCVQRKSRRLGDALVSEADPSPLIVVLGEIAERRQTDALFAMGRAADAYDKGDNISFEAITKLLSFACYGCKTRQERELGDRIIRSVIAKNRPEFVRFGRRQGTQAQELLMVKSGEGSPRSASKSGIQSQSIYLSRFGQTTTNNPQSKVSQRSKSVSRSNSSAFKSNSSASRSNKSSIMATDAAVGSLASRKDLVSRSKTNSRMKSEASEASEAMADPFAVITKELSLRGKCNCRKLEAALRKARPELDGHRRQLLQKFTVALESGCLASNDEVAGVVHVIGVKLHQIAGDEKFTTKGLIELWRGGKGFFRGSGTDKCVASLYERFKKGNSVDRVGVCQLFRMIEEATGYIASEAPCVSDVHSNVIFTMVEKCKCVY